MLCYSQSNASGQTFESSTWRYCESPQFSLLSVTFSMMKTKIQFCFLNTLRITKNTKNFLISTIVMTPALYHTWKLCADTSCATDLQYYIPIRLNRKGYGFFLFVMLLHLPDDNSLSIQWVACWPSSSPAPDQSLVIGMIGCGVVSFSALKFFIASCDGEDYCRSRCLSKLAFLNMRLLSLRSWVHLLDGSWH